MDDIESVGIDFADCRMTAVFTDGNMMVLEKIPPSVMDRMAHALAEVWEQFPTGNAGE